MAVPKSIWKYTTTTFIQDTAIYPDLSSNIIVKKRDENDGGKKCWFQFYKIYFNFTYYLCIVPFRLKYSEKTHEFLLHRNLFQTMLCFLLQCSSLLYIRSSFLAGWDYVKSGTDQLSYFDLMFLVLLYGFDVSTKSTLWFYQSCFVQLCQTLHDSPLILLPSSWSPWRVKFLVCSICTIYLIPSVFYIILVLGVNPTDTQAILDGITVHSESIFDLTPGSLDTTIEYPFSVIMKFLATFITIYTSAFWHYSDVLALTSNLFFHRVSTDFFDALRRGDIPTSQVLTYYDSFRCLNKKFNKAAGLVTCVFLTYPLSYYATHLVDMLNDSEIMNRFSMCIYLGNLTVTLLLAAKIHFMCNHLKRWLCKEERVVTIIPIQQLRIILFELENESMGVNGFFTITYGFAGEILNLLLTLTIITIQFKMFEMTVHQA